MTVMLFKVLFLTFNLTLNLEPGNVLIYGGGGGGS